MLSPTVSHIGIAVEDIEVAMEELGPVLGLSWASVQTLTIAGHQLRFTYSAEGPPHLELIQGPAGSIWDASGGGHQHHIGFWSNDLRGDRARLASAGLKIALDTPGATYQQAVSGLRVELVDERVRPALERWLAGGDFA